ncbi:hypothetical protein AGMMS49975_22220 [Clostridia bacterium]|nr:hypothetical protein AGMMS49975_22220 [Clostridia bacterium]
MKVQEAVKNAADNSATDRYAPDSDKLKAAHDETQSQENKPDSQME